MLGNGNEIWKRVESFQEKCTEECRGTREFFPVLAFVLPALALSLVISFMRACCGDKRELKQTRRRRKKERHLKM